MSERQCMPDCKCLPEYVREVIYPCITRHQCANVRCRRDVRLNKTTARYQWECTKVETKEKEHWIAMPVCSVECETVLARDLELKKCQPKTCRWCRKYASDKEPLLQCKQCKHVVFCGKECLGKAWKNGHKRV